MDSSMIAYFKPRLQEQALLSPSLTATQISDFRAKLATRLDRTLYHTAYTAQKPHLLWLYQEFGLDPHVPVSIPLTRIYGSIPSMLLDTIAVETKEHYYECLEICCRAGVNGCDPANEDASGDKETLLVYCLRMPRRERDSMATVEMRLGALALLLSHTTFSVFPLSYTFVGKFSVWDLAVRSTGTEASDFFAHHAVCMLLEARIPLHSHYGVLNMVLRHIQNSIACMRVFSKLLPLVTDVNEPSEWQYENELVSHVPDLPLVAALSRRNSDSVELARMLLERGADPNALVPLEERGTQQQQVPPLYWAVKNTYCFESLIDLLLLHGAEPSLLPLNRLTRTERERLVPFFPVKKRKT
jgi:hypothetical protein